MVCVFPSVLFNGLVIVIEILNLSVRRQAVIY